MKIVVGLGNLGKHYIHTRHNVGFRVLDQLCKTFNMEKQWHVDCGRIDDVFFCKPQTMMNDSGRAVQLITQFYHCAPSDILLVYDDKDLPFGTLRARTHGSDAGHRGVASILHNLNTTHIARVRIGIAQPHITNTTNFVLGRFTRQEEQRLPNILNAAKEIIQTWIQTNTLEHHDRIVE